MSSPEELIIQAVELVGMHRVLEILEGIAVDNAEVSPIESLRDEWLGYSLLIRSILEEIDRAEEEVAN